MKQTDIMTLEYYKTYRINTAEAWTKVDIDRSRLCYINSRGAFGWCDILAKLSEVFLDAQLKSRLTDRTPHYTIVTPEWVLDKLWEGDEYESYDRIEFVINNFIPPDNGIIISVYIISEEADLNLFEPYHDDKDKRSNGVEWPFITNTKWSLKDQGLPKEYVTWNRLGRTFQKEQYPHLLQIEEWLEEALDRYDIPHKIIDYSMSPKRTYDIMSSSALHISYVGATWWLAHYMDIPIFDYGLTGPMGSLFGELRAPGRAKKHPQMTWDSSIGRFKEKKHLPLVHLSGQCDKEELVRNLLKHVPL